MKSNAIVRIVLFSIAIFLLLSILGAAFVVRNYISIAQTDEPMTIRGSSFGVPADTIKNLDIEWVAGSIIIQPVEGQTEIFLSETVTTNSNHQMFCTESGDTLKVEYRKNFGNISWIGINNYNFISKDLLIEVPMDWDCRKLSIDAAAADIILTNLTIDQLDFDGASGVITLNNCAINDMDIDTASGDLNFNGTLDTLDFDAASASFSGILHNCPREIQVDSLSGRLELFLPADCGFSLSNDSLSGRLSSDFEINTHGDALVHGDGSCRIDVSGLSGDVHINKHAVSSETALCTDENCTDESHSHKEKGHH